MTLTSTELLQEALARSVESANVDFKTTFEAAQKRDWLELIKDIAAFSNSGGGYILVGLNNDKNSDTQDF